MNHNQEHEQKYHWLRDILSPLKPRLKEIFLQSFFINLLALALPLFSLQVYDRVIGHRGMTTLVALCFGIVLAFGFDYLLRVARSKLLQNTAVHIDVHLGQWLYQRFAALPLAVLESRPSGYWRMLFQDASVIRATLSGSSAMLIADIPFAILFLLVIAVIALPLFWVLMFILPLFGALTWYNTKRLEISAAQEAAKNHTHESFIAELLAGRVTVKSMMADVAATPQWETLHANAISHSWAHGSRTDKAVVYGQILSSVTTVLLVSVGALAIIDQSLTMGALIATTMLSNRIISPMNQLVSQWKGFARCHQAIRQLDQFSALPQNLQYPSITRPQPAANLMLENISYTHQNTTHPALKECNISFHEGEMVGIVGRNGCGKTTLLKLIQGLYTPQTGRIQLDGIDTAQLSRAELSAWMGYVPQECFLFNGTIRENIAKAWPEASDEIILNAVEMAGATDFINALPEGYASQIGENGQRLSGGQRQRLAIARALLRNPPILLLDEVTSNLDTEAEIDLRNHLQQLANGRLILLATHSLVMLRACHKIVVMEAGQIIAAGATKDILPRLLGKDTGNISTAA